MAVTEEMEDLCTKENGLGEEETRAELVEELALLRKMVEEGNHARYLEELGLLRKMVDDLVVRVTDLEEFLHRDARQLPLSVGDLLDPNGFDDKDSVMTFSSSATFTPSAAMGYPSPPRNGFAGFDARSSGYSSETSPPLMSLAPSDGDFFAMANGHFGAKSDVQDEKVTDLLRNPAVLASLMQHVQRYNMNVPEVSPRSTPMQSFYVPQSPPASNLRRNNSNRSRRSRRFSCPDASRTAGWPMGNGSNPQSRHGSFIGLPPSDLYGIQDFDSDDAFGDSGPTRSSAGIKELEILCRFGEIGVGQGQMNAPHGFCLGKEQQVIVADTNNHRIQFFDSKGNFVHVWGKSGKRDGQLWYPRKVAYMAETVRVVVCDRGHDRSRIQIFNYHGRFEQIIAVDYVAIVAGMTVFQNKIVIVDSVNPTCLVLDPDQNGSVAFWFDCSKYMKEPSDVVVDNTSKRFLICDFKGHCVCVFNGRGEFVRSIGDNKVINFPNGIDVTKQGQIMVGDSHGNRFHVAVYSGEGQFLAEYECPHMKVSRCCGLVLTAENHIVTIAKNNNFILVLDRLNGNALLEDEVEQQETGF